MNNNKSGEFVRWESQFRNWVTPSGDAGPSGTAGFKAEPGRYHLYISHACPWAHRTMIFRKLKGLEKIISVSVVNPVMPQESWNFGAYPGATVDHVHGYQTLAQLYERVAPGYTGVVTVPVLYDKQQDQIVNNESSEIIRMLNSAFNAWGDVKIDLYPPALQTDINTINAFVYDHINNGVYKTGFAKSQQAYEYAFDQLFTALDELEARLNSQRYLLGDQITEADWRLFPTLVRFDPVYYSHFKCNRQRIIDYPNLWAYLRSLYQQPGIAETVNMAHIKTHYYTSHPFLNPSGIIPKGPDIDFMSQEGMEQYC
ncbi:glutathione S-transferase family protein [Sedimenticola selenatireducens]|uniref:Glutathione S-transferase family protein n=1 Tax=Sedimenticola selenatireducens TaxID=191960 RepID=A0A558DVR8_9GAMM|nr:glutathione S-transferase family protein [Sedimenticola selenatireducens]TVO77836.1 glutathione S-transferase family protein [Sedimenticola selenatireducens]TVT65141.1 MAG: glutathione S-transferase family protein [Sedimenticola selenatireducens]